MQSILAVEHLSKQFGAVTAVDDLSFSIQPGDVYAFLGQNGAGKSTTMRMILGLIHPTAGKVFINGEEFHSGRRHLLRHIGAIIERPDLYGYLSGWDNLKIMARMSGQKIPDSRLEELLELVHLKGRERDKVKGYSQGMKQRLGIAITMVHNPALLILDEPTNGLDPQGIADMRNLIQHLSREHGKTILISSHLLSEVQQIATSMLIVHKGRKVAEGRVEELLHPADSLIDLRFEENESLMRYLQDSRWKEQIRTASPTQVVFRMAPAEAPALAQLVVQQGGRIASLQTRHSLEDLFISLTQDAATPPRTV